MSRLVFAREALTVALWNEVAPLLADHWREIAHYQDIPLDPSPEAYYASDQAGILRIYTVRQPIESLDLDGTLLVGYAVFFVRPAPHYAGSIQAVQDVLFLSKASRGGTGYRFIRWCDDQLRAEGVQLVAHHVKLAHDFGPLLERQGYECMERVFVKRLDRVSAPVALSPLRPHRFWSPDDETNDLARTHGIATVYDEGVL